MILFFGGAIIAVGKGSQTSAAIYIRRKRIIFPVRALTFSFNIILFSAMAQLTATSELRPIAMILSIGGLVASASILIFIWGLGMRLGSRG